MFQFLQKLKSLFHFHRVKHAEETAINEILHKGFLRLREVAPQTHQQWLLLQRAIAQSETEVPPVKARFTPRFALGVAGVAIAIVGVYVYFTSIQLSPDTFTTGRGEQKEIVLKDGSQVTLNYATELVVPKLRAGEPRRLSLTGEAYFRVRQNETPFIVSTNWADINVVGTEFNLRVREGTLEVAVIRGIVKVRVVKDGKDSSLLLSQHQMALCPENDFPVRIGEIPSPEYPGWMHGKLFFNRTSFLAACREIEMRFDIAITIDDQDFRHEIITGILDARTAESALTALCELTGKRFTHDGQAYTIY